MCINIVSSSHSGMAQARVSSDQDMIHSHLASCFYHFFIGHFDVCCFMLGLRARPSHLVR